MKIYSQNTQYDNSTKGLTLNLIQYTQNPENKKVRFEVEIRSDINSDRVEIRWILDGNVRYADPSQKKQILSVTKNSIHKRSIEVIPTGTNEDGIGISQVMVEVEAFFVNSSILSTDRKTFLSNKQEEVVVIKTNDKGERYLDLPDEYIHQKNILILRNIVTIITITLLVSIIGYFGIKKFIRYLNKDDRY
ncbi:MAG: hypothetical protein NZZ41_03650 [Candidatus Dojkabacteria bacterium]|nr:hypothetical protein [Candidatus Dojkabacteria bacterium]